jgi:predicted transcriptional regulator
MSEEPARQEEVVADLFFQFSSPDRWRIISELQKEELHLNVVSKRVDITATEALRQLQRLTQSGIIERMPDGRYRLTSYGKLALLFSSSFELVAKHREYFLEHDASLLPPAFRSRLGELSDCVLLSTAVDTFNTVTGMLQNAREKIDGTIEVGFATQLEVMKRRIEDGVKVRWLLQESYLPKAREELRPLKKLPEIRHTPWLWGHLYQNGSAADVQLRRNDGTQDYLSFHGKDPKFLQWASDFFEYEWNKAKPWYP